MLTSDGGPVIDATCLHAAGGWRRARAALVSQGQAAEARGRPAGRGLACAGPAPGRSVCRETRQRPQMMSPGRGGTTWEPRTERQTPRRLRPVSPVESGGRVVTQRRGTHVATVAIDEKATHEVAHPYIPAGCAGLTLTRAAPSPVIRGVASSFRPRLRRRHGKAGPDRPRARRSRDRGQAVGRRMPEGTTAAPRRSSPSRWSGSRPARPTLC